MSQWPRWSLVGEPIALAKYVLPAEITSMVVLPGPDSGSRIGRLKEVYETLRAIGVGYAYEAPSDERGRQVIRDPWQVLWAPRHATCLDMALVLSGACLAAGLEPFVAIVESADPSSGSAAHALVGVRIDDAPDGQADQGSAVGQDGGNGLDAIWPEEPGWLAARLQVSEDGPPGVFVVLDSTGITHPQVSSPSAGLDVPFRDAVENGARLLDSSRWRLGVDIASCWRERDILPLEKRPTRPPLRAPYLNPESAQTPLALMRADYGIVPFQSRHEVTVLEQWCHQTAAGRTTGIAIIQGMAGSGKTRLALEIAQRLSRHGWYTGPLPEPSKAATTDWQRGLDWLGSVASPVLVVVDFADARGEEIKALLRAVQDRPGSPAVILLTARGARRSDDPSTPSAYWLEDVLDYCRHIGHAIAQLAVPLPAYHPQAALLALRAAAVFAEGPAARPSSGIETGGVRQEWTTLDHILLGWLSAQAGSELPVTREQLYGEVLRHEITYWTTAYREQTGKPAAPVALLRLAAAVAILRTPNAVQLNLILRAVPELADAGETRLAITNSLETCLRQGPGERLTLRPDPVADHLVMSIMRERPELLALCLAGCGDMELSRTLATFERAAAADPALASDVLAAWLREYPGRWFPVLVVAATMGDTALAVVTRLVEEQHPDLPLEELAARLPTENVRFLRLAVLIESRRLEGLRALEGSDLEQIARLLVQLGKRQSAAGDRAGALASTAEAVTHYRTLAQAEPDEFLPDLGTALNGLALRHFSVGDNRKALTAIDEAVTLIESLADSGLPAFLPNLAIALANQAMIQHTLGDISKALITTVEAVARYRALVEIDRAEFLGGLARTLVNQSSLQSREDPAAGLATINEAVIHLRVLADDAPEMYLPDLAGALHNQANRLGEARDGRGALMSSTEAVAYCRTLADAAPAAFLPVLADALSSLSTHQAAAGDQRSGLASMTEAITHYRQLADRVPAFFLPKLANALAASAVCQHAVGDLGGALDSVTEAVALFRGLARSDPAAHLSRLATVLNGKSAILSITGKHQRALMDSTEAVAHLRTLAGANPAAFLGDLAEALRTHSIHHGAVGDHESELASIDESVAHFRALASDDDATSVLRLAGALQEQSTARNRVNDRDGALTSISESVACYRRLAIDDRASLLPDLASSLTELSKCQSVIGEDKDALVNITQAVSYYRDLARDDTGTFLPQLARALDIQSNRRNCGSGGNGIVVVFNQRDAYYHTLARDNPEAFLPDLAKTLSTWARCANEAADPDSAIASSTEAIAYFRMLADNDRTAYLPDLARALYNQANHQRDAGDHGNALISLEEAIVLWRELAAGDEAAFVQKLAMALTSQADRRSALGQYAGALASIAEAIAHYRKLMDADPVAFLPELARALNNQSNHFGAVSDRASALASIAEAIAHYRVLVATDPATHLPAFTTLLSSLSGHQAASGDTTSALAANAEAVTHLRTLADSSPDLYGPSLGMALNTKAAYESSLENRTSALASLGEAISIYLTEAARDGDRFLPDLILLLGNLAQLADPADTDAAWLSAIGTLQTSANRAELRANYARYLSEQDRIEPALKQLVLAATEAEAGPGQSLVRARKTIRVMVQGLDTRNLELPDWAIQILPEAHVGLVVGWAKLSDWREALRYLRHHQVELQTPAFEKDLAVMSELHPGSTAIQALTDTIQQIHKLGPDKLIADAEDQFTHAALLAEWINLSTPAESAAFFARHHVKLRSAAARVLLAATGEPHILWHLSVIRLADSLPATRVAAVLTDPSVATDEALAAIDAGMPDRLALIIDAAPALAGGRSTAALFSTVFALRSGDHTVARAQAHLASENADSFERRAYAIHLRNYAAATSDPAINELADLIEMKATQS